MAWDLEILQEWLQAILKSFFKWLVERSQNVTQGLEKQFLPQSD
jgi:hypothetical protein